MNSKAYNLGARAAAEGFTGTNPYDADLAAEWAEGFAARIKPCPCCGADDLQKYTMHTPESTTEFTECLQCKTSAPTSVWNTRPDTQGDLVGALREIRDAKPIVTRNFSTAERYPEDEVDATVTELEYDYLQEIAGAALAKAGVK